MFIKGTARDSFNACDEAVRLTRTHGPALRLILTRHGCRITYRDGNVYETQHLTGGYNGTGPNCAAYTLVVLGFEPDLSTALAKTTQGGNSHHSVYGY